MKKRFLLAMAALSLLILFTGCQNKGTAPTLTLFCYFDEGTDLAKAVGMNYDEQYCMDHLSKKIIFNTPGTNDHDTYILTLLFSDPDLDVTTFHLSNDNFKKNDWTYGIIQNFENQYVAWINQGWNGTGSGYLSLQGYLEDAAGNESDVYELTIEVVDPKDAGAKLSSNLSVTANNSNSAVFGKAE